MKLQHISLSIFAVVLLSGIILYDIALAVVGLLGIAFSGWGFVYPDRANFLIYRVQSNIAKERLEKEYREYQHLLNKAEGYIIRFADTFDMKFPLEWSIDKKGNVMNAAENELGVDKLIEPFKHFQELLQDEGMEIPDYVVQLEINRMVDDMRYNEFKILLEKLIGEQPTPKNIVKTFAQQIGTTPEEVRYMNRVFTIDFLLRYLTQRFSQRDIQLQLQLDITKPEKAKTDVQLSLKHYSQDLEKERRVNTMRGILYGKIQPTSHKEVAQWLAFSNKELEEDLRELFVRMGYEVKEPSTRVQGTDFLLKRLQQKLSIKNAFVMDDTTVSAKTIQEAFAGMKYWDCEIGIVVSNGKFSDEAIDLARKLGIEMWDADTLQRMLDKYWNNDIEYWQLLKHKKIDSLEEKTSDAPQVLQSYSH
ncbi:hypothetical protein BHU72_02830 [Desulfuribacillus stibiiarsenatis]|uniref:Restriction endonuclease type IV Mrr domain-containing protein n=1 Tax=Desulfuribacillus stibiiarsenatis TaxID=1390249 RepID=A0A1E5L6Z0_9FIRM|nr:restriction endonuclease [Desulfuribacillus stibiiarsenatis]OEH85733.1 hypothetical protein BHU72_02830 [Desulfuribacillus stibiiarsenatis]